MDDKLTSLTRAIQAEGDPTSDTPAADPHGFRARIIRIANDLYNMQRPDRRARLMAGDELMALAEVMRAAFCTQDAEIAALKAQVETLKAQVEEIAALKARIATLETIGPDLIGVGPNADDDPPNPGKDQTPRFKPIAHLETLITHDIPNPDGPVSIQPTPKSAKHEKASA